MSAASLYPVASSRRRSRALSLQDWNRITHSLEVSLERPHIPQLDGFRALAAILLVLAHSAIDFPGVELFRYIDRYGMLGIQLSFVLSGYLITRVLLETREGESYYKNFFARRFLRVGPLYYLQILAVVAVAAIMGRLGGVPWWAYFLFLSNMFFSAEKSPAALGTLWPLAVEVQFYLVWPFVVGRVGKRTIERIAIATVVLVMALRFASLLSYHHTLLQLDALAAGVWIACKGDEIQRWRRWACVLAWVLPLGASLEHGFANELSRAMQVVGGGSLLIVLLTTNSWATRALGSAWMRYIGGISFGIFLLHSYVFNAFRATALHGRVARSNSLWQSSLCLLIEYALVLLLAFASYHLFEKWFLRLKVHFGPEPAGEPEYVANPEPVGSLTA